MSKPKSGLGRDFFDIFNDNSLDTIKSAAQMLRVSDIEPRSDQPRKKFDRESLESLAQSISVYGILQPIIVRKNDNTEGVYDIIAGERRWRAAKMAGLTEMPCVVLDSDALRAAQIALVENLQREDLNPIDEAFAYQALIENFSLTQDQVSKQVGKSRAAVTNALRLLDLPSEILDLLRSGEISAGHARALLGLEDSNQMMPLATKIISRELSVREVEAAVKKLNAPDENTDDIELLEHLTQSKAYYKTLENRSRSIVGHKVKIIYTGKKKNVQIAYDSNEDLEKILTSLCGKEIFNEE